MALLDGGVVLHLPVDHDGARAVAHFRDDALGPEDLVHRRAEDVAGDVDLHRVQAPRADAAHEESVAELVFAGERVLDVAEGAVVGKDSVGRAGVHHARHGVVPEILLHAGARGVGVVLVRVGSHHVARVTAAHAGGLHAAAGSEVGGAE